MKAVALKTWRLLLRWSNPYTKPPVGQPEILAETTIEQSPSKGAPVEREWPEAFREQMARLYRPGCGYALHIAQDLVATLRPWSKERKGAVRRGNLRKRIAKQVGPLFAHKVDELVGQEVAKRPGYFGGEA